ncbi:hypothetical protein ACG74X_19340 [Marivita sp. S0852]|uniref:hypothetical protein n=1 Tax=Marivita sp. S0852 TaxID=3373893 RepID=UPI0039823193
MSLLRFIVRSFHPLSNFGVGGLGFHGDNRGFTHEEKVTSRITAIVQIDLEGQSIRRETVFSHPSTSLFGWFTQDYSAKETQPRFTMFNGTIDPYRPDGDQGVHHA